jgi:O-antigen/teichoic acid export membrane protein
VSARWSASFVLRGGSLLVLARVAQAALGLVALALTARSLGLSGFGEFSTAFAVALGVGAVFSAALSDAVAATGRSLTGLAPALVVVLVVALLVGAAASVPTGSLVLVVTGVWWYIATCVLTASGLGRARHDGRVLAIAACQVIGALATVLLVAAFAFAGLREWELFLLAYAVQPLGLALLSIRDSDRVGEQARGVRAVWRMSGSYVIAYTGSTVAVPVSTLLLRVIAGPSAVGAYAGLMRLLEILAVVPWLMGGLVLPAMVAMRRENAPRQATVQVARLNVVVALVSAAVVALGLQLVWIGWQILYPEEPVDAVLLLLLGAGMAIRVAFGLPDRVLQSAGRAAVVARFAISYALVTPIASAVLIRYASGTTGAGLSFLAAMLAWSIGLTTRAGLPRTAVAAHVVLAATATGAAALAAVTVSAESLVLSTVTGLLSACAVSAVGWILHQRLARLEGPSGDVPGKRHRGQDEQREVEYVLDAAVHHQGGQARGTYAGGPVTKR